MSKNEWPERRTEELGEEAERAARERRRSRRLRLDLDTAVPIQVRSAGGLVQWGVARNISEGGMLIELQEPPPIGAYVAIKILGVSGSEDAPDAVVVHAEVRHALSWNFGSDDRRSGISAVGVRFVPPPQVVSLPAEGSPIH
jgi:hypothetical protein